MEKGKKTGWLELILSILIAAGVFWFAPQIAALGDWGYFGAFLISIISSATIIFPAPGWIIIAGMGRTMNPLLLGLVSGLGSAIGELTGFLAGAGVRNIVLEDKKTFENYTGIIRKYDIAGIAVLAALPFPLFDLAGLAAGALGIKWWRFLIGCAIGKVVKYVLLAYTGAWSARFF